MIEQCRRKFPYGFLLAIFIIIVILYIAFFKLLILDIQPWPTIPTVIFLTIYHIVLILLIWAIIESFRTDPGRVPSRWGFDMDNQDRKYCLLCHVFKPERTHHCSACNRCVLNMDHHCPWINTCIGFYNRKAFILMLIYTTFMASMNAIAFLTAIPTLINKFGDSPSAGFVIQAVLVAAAFVFNSVILVTIVLFLKFHLGLIFRNLTTLETLELKRQGKDPQESSSKYDIGTYYNWAQVFGRKSISWPIPIFLSDEGPVGDGVIWPKNPNLG